MNDEQIADTGTDEGLGGSDAPEDESNLGDGGVHV